MLHISSAKTNVGLTYKTCAAGHLVRREAVSDEELVLDDALRLVALELGPPNVQAQVFERSHLHADMHDTQACHKLPCRCGDPERCTLATHTSCGRYSSPSWNLSVRDTIPSKTMNRQVSPQQGATTRQTGGGVCKDGQTHRVQQLAQAVAVLHADDGGKGVRLVVDLHRRLRRVQGGHPGGAVAALGHRARRSDDPGGTR